MATLTVRDGLTAARTILVARSTDPRFSGAEQAQCSECAGACQNAIDLLRADNTIAPNRRNQQYTVIKDRLHATTSVLDAHDAELTAPEFYNALDLMDYAAEAILEGAPTFTIQL